MAMLSPFLLHQVQPILEISPPSNRANGTKNSSHFEHKEEPSTPVFQVATTLTWDLGGTKGEQYKGMADDPNACLPIHVDEYTYLGVGDVAQCYFWGLADCSRMPLEIVYPGEVSTPVGPPARANWRSFRYIRYQPSAFASSDAKANLAIDAASGAASSGFSSSSPDEITCPQSDSAKWNTIIVGLLSGNLLILIGILGVNLTGYLQEKRKTRSYAPVYGKESEFRD
ncbi:hypothetical protein DL96DRAFT_1611047 [Flagelloscypha sp. PMI_526]|nr:hypothetical protein DL96DRAFT_1611047 [Flagelloscypha sp. PMI_526]